MKQDHQLRKQKITTATSYNDNSDDEEIETGRASTTLKLTNTESNTSNWYPEHHENTLPAFFDQIIDAVLLLCHDSFARFKLTTDYQQFIQSQP